MTSVEKHSILKQVRCTAPVNMAVIKYWGKRDEQLHLPLNGSLSVTLDQDDLATTTEVKLSRDFPSDRLWINGEEAPINTRVETCLNEIRRRVRKRLSSRGDAQESHVTHDDGCTTTRAGGLLDSSVRAEISSSNNFPTAAGLASSAAGYACLVFALARAYGVEGDVSDIARRGSGSACRSVYGGFVEWDPGFDATPSVAKQLFSHSHWPSLRVCVVVVSDSQKSTSSSDGMKRSVMTSPSLRHRADVVVPERLKQMRCAISNRDFASFAELTMKDSNSLHACCLDSFPPISYLNSTSYAIIDLVHFVNTVVGRPVLAYTFDAGPNACLFFLESEAAKIMKLLCRVFGLDPKNPQQLRGMKAPTEDVEKDFEVGDRNLEGTVKFLILTKVGPGPRTLDDENSV